MVGGVRKSPLLWGLGPPSKCFYASCGRRPRLTDRRAGVDPDVSPSRSSVAGTPSRHRKERVRKECTDNFVVNAWRIHGPQRTPLALSAGWPSLRTNTCRLSIPAETTDGTASPPPPQDPGGAAPGYPALSASNRHHISPAVGSLPLSRTRDPHFLPSGPLGLQVEG